MKRQFLNNQYVTPQEDIVDFLVNMKSTIKLVEAGKLPLSVVSDMLDDFRDSAAFVGGDKCYTISECVEKRYSALEREILKHQLG